MFFLLPFLLIIETSVADCRYKFIHNTSELIQFSNEVNAGTNYYGYIVYLVADIDFTGLSSQHYPSNEFRGTFDGQGYVVKNLVISDSFIFTGLFGQSTGVTVKNTVIDSSCSFTSSYTVSGQYPKVAGINCLCNPVNGPCILENNVNMANLRYTGSKCYNIYRRGVWTVWHV